MTLCISSNAFAAIAYDAVSSFEDGLASSLTFSHVNAGNIIIVGTGVRDATDADRPVVSVTYNGDALIPIRADDNTTDNIASELWYRVNPDIGTFNVVVTFTNTTTTAGAGAISLSGVDTSSPIDAQNGTTGSSAASSVNVVTVADNAWIVDTATTTEISSSDITPTGTGKSEKYEISLTSDNVNGGTIGPVTPAGSTATGWSWTGTEGWSISAVSLKPDTGGGGGSNIKTGNGLAVASVKTWDDLAIASTKSKNGLQ
ncbi:hypothetical protein UFOVP594_30 [uncultured Caudovirales phage]|uniref:Uncharacterized protein n=1 Tax=uncultured Caudovirales phage TaxID=2100421 RepID=A0A6J5N098_9CAUD|nr:hypothetical protein UFOVP594_30 [uncultured Caudovirales phage]